MKKRKFFTLMVIVVVIVGTGVLILAYLPSPMKLAPEKATDKLEKEKPSTTKEPIDIPPPVLDITEKRPGYIAGIVSDPEATIRTSVSEKDIYVDTDGHFAVSIPSDVEELTVSAISLLGKKTEKIVMIERDEPEAEIPQHVQTPASRPPQLTAKPIEVDEDSLPTTVDVSGSVIADSGLASLIVKSANPQISITVGSDNQFTTRIQLHSKSDVIILRATDNQGESVEELIELSVIPAASDDDILFTINSPKNGYVTKEQQVTIKGTIEYGDEDINKLTLSPGTMDQRGDFHYTADLEEGENFISLAVLDEEKPEKRVAKTVTIIRDTTPPYFTHNGELKTQILLKENSMAPTWVKVTDNMSPLPDISRSWSTHIKPPDGVKEYMVQIRPSELTEGENSLTASDAVGNTASLKVMKIRSLKLEVTTPWRNAIINGKSVTVVGNVTGGYGNIALKTNEHIQACPSGNFRKEIPLKNEGKNVITISAQDSLESVESVSITVIRDTTAPVFMYAGKNTTSVERWISEGDFKIGISDKSGISSVILDGKKLSPDPEQNWGIAVKDLKDKDGDMVGRLTVRDLAEPANEVHLDIRARKNPKQEQLWAEVLKDFNEGRYEDAENILETLRTKFGMSSSVRLFRGITTYHNSLKPGEDQFKLLWKAIDDLEIALAQAATYSKNKDYIHLNRYYLGMSHYKLTVLGKQMGNDDMEIQQARRGSVEYFNGFLENVGNRVPKHKKDVEKKLNELLVSGTL